MAQVSQAEYQEFLDEQSINDVSTFENWAYSVSNSYTKCGQDIRALEQKHNDLKKGLQYVKGLEANEYFYKHDEIDKKINEIKENQKIYKKEMEDLRNPFTSTFWNHLLNR